MDSVTAQFLQDSLRGYTPTIPVLPNYAASLRQGFDVANQLDTAQAAATHEAAAEQALASAQQQYNYTAQTNPYNAELLQEKVATLPLDKKYNQAVQSATVDQIEARAADYRAHAAARGATTGGSGYSPFQGTAPVYDSDNSGASSAAGETDADTSAPAPATDSAPAPALGDTSTLDSTTLDNPAPSSGSAGVPLSLNDSRPIPASDASVADADASSAPPPGVDLDDLVEVHDADKPTAAMWHQGQRISAVQPTYPADGSDLPAPDPGMIPGYTAASVDPLHNGAAYQMVSNDSSQPIPSGGDDGGDATGGGAGSSSGIRVPVSEADLQAQHNAFEAHAAQMQASGMTPMARKQLNDEGLALQRAEGVYRQSASAKVRQQGLQLRQDRASASATKTSGVLSNDQPPEREGYTLRPTGYINGKQHWLYVPNDEVQEKQIAKVGSIVKGATGGDVSDLLADRGDYQDGVGHVPGTHFFMRQTSLGPMETGVPEPVYQRLRGMTDPIYYGSPASRVVPAPAAPAPTSAAAISAMADDPEFSPSAAAIQNLGNDPEFPMTRPLPGAGGSTAIHLGLGTDPNAPGAKVMLPGARAPQPTDTPAASVTDQATAIKAQFAAGKLSRADAVKQLQALGFD